MEMLSARPMSRHAFIEREKKVKATPSGLILPDDMTKADRQQADTLLRGTVVALGEGAWGLVKTGDIVLFQFAEADEVEVEAGRWVFSVKAHAILAVEEP